MYGTKYFTQRPAKPIASTKHTQTRILTMANANPSGSKPLPLKQRTSSIDQRRDYTTQTWTSLLGLLKLREFVVTVDHFSIWRRHLAWAVPNGKDLREHMTQRYASSMVFMSLLLSTELQVLFNSAGVTTQMRHALLTEDYLSTGFWAGFAVIMSAFLTLLGLISTFTAWIMVSSVSDANAHCIFRSSIGQYVAELPGRFIVGSIYSFLLWLVLFLFLLLPFGVWSTLLLLIVLVLFVHTITAFSAFGRVIMHSGAMGSQPIFEPTYEQQLNPYGLQKHLFVKARANLVNKTSIMRQYQSKTKPLDRFWSEDELSRHMSDRSLGSTLGGTDSVPQPTRKRTASLVKFSDGFDTNGERLQTFNETPRNGSIVVNSQETPISTLTAGSKFTSPSRKVVDRPPRPLSTKRSDPVMKSPEQTNKANEASREEGNAMLLKWLSPNSDSVSDYLSSANSEDANGIPPAVPPLSHISTSRKLSVSSSLAGSQQDEEEFEREYGSLFDPETGPDYSFDYSSDGDKQISRIREHDRQNKTEESTGLLEDDDMENGNYSSFPRS